MRRHGRIPGAVAEPFPSFLLGDYECADMQRRIMRGLTSEVPCDGVVAANHPILNMDCTVDDLPERVAVLNEALADEMLGQAGPNRRRTPRRHAGPIKSPR